MRMRTWTAATLVALAGGAPLGAQTPPPDANQMQAPAEQSGGSHSAPGETGAEPQGTGEFVDEAVKDSEKAQQEDRKKVDGMVEDSVKEADEAPSGVELVKPPPPPP